MKQPNNKESKWIWLVAHFLGLLVILTTVLCYVYLYKETPGEMAIELEWKKPLIHVAKHLFSVSM
ncbi:MAG: hypothetical protein KDC92_05555 [Bacteroidetes bacterium]|nr:hypothetical protein [Bacteroidota bacterium]